MILDDKVAIVTGAGQGIGEGIAREMADNGAKVVVCDFDEEKAKKVAKDIGEDKAFAIGCDVSNKAEVDFMVAKTMEKYGKVDILVNNAGIFPFKPFEQMEEKDWQKVQDVNLKSMFLTCSATVKKMQKGGKIVNISSIAAFVGFEGLAHYCASKGGVNGFTRALALELAKKKINVNAVAPGAINTPGASNPDEELKKQTIMAIPAGRMGEPGDIANAVIFLASDMADYITGQILVVDGGYTLR